MLTPFLRIRLTGGRFTGAAVPLSLFDDLGAVEELIIATARHRFLVENPGRKRAPGGFARDLRLAATGIAEGSAIVEVGLVDTTAELPTMPRRHHPYYESARDDILRTMRSAEKGSVANGGDASGVVPPEMLHHFERIGRSLAREEAMCFDSVSGGEVATLTAESRQRLLFSSLAATSITEEMTLRGFVPEADQDRGSFELLLIDGQKLSGPMAEPHRETVLTAFRGFRDRLPVQVEVVGTRDRRRQIVGWEAVRDIVILDPLDAALQLDELRALEDGWLDGEGIAPPADGLDRLAAGFEEHYPDELPLPHIYPTPTGGAQLEWTFGSNEVSVEVDLTTGVGEWLEVDVSSGRAEAESLNLHDSSGWSTLRDGIGPLVQPAP